MSVWGLKHPAYNVHAQCYMVICDLSGGTVFLHVALQTARFSGGKKVPNIKLCCDLLYNFCLKHFSF